MQADKVKRERPRMGELTNPSETRLKEPAEGAQSSTDFDCGTGEVLVEASHLSKEYRSHGASLHAVEDFSLTIRKGHSIALVGESGAGKSTVVRMLMRLVAPTSGELSFRGRPLSRGDGAGRLREYWRHVQLVTQDPSRAFDPRVRIGKSIAEPLRAYGLCPRPEREERISRLLEQVGLSPDLATRRPGQLSGGQLQRASIARALACEPELIVLDEATSALDATIQLRVLDLLASLREQVGITYLFVSHDLAVVERMCTHVIVMRSGSVVERFVTGRSCTHTTYVSRLYDAVMDLGKPKGSPLGIPPSSVGDARSRREEAPKT